MRSSGAAEKGEGLARCVTRNMLSTVPVHDTVKSLFASVRLACRNSLLWHSGTRTYVTIDRKPLLHARGI